MKVSLVFLLAATLMTVGVATAKEPTEAYKPFEHFEVETDTRRVRAPCQDFYIDGDVYRYHIGKLDGTWAYYVVQRFDQEWNDALANQLTSAQRVACNRTLHHHYMQLYLQEQQDICGEIAANGDDDGSGLYRFLSPDPNYIHGTCGLIYGLNGVATLPIRITHVRCCLGQ